MRSLKLIGYWREKELATKPYNNSMIKISSGRTTLDPDFWRDSTNDKYPWPKDLIKHDFWDLDEQYKVLEYLKSGVPCNQYRGSSNCRICGDVLGYFERSDNAWIWPDLFDHYIEKHSISIPLEFLEHIRSNNYKIPEVGVEKNSVVPLDQSFWIGCQGK